MSASIALPVQEQSSDTLIETLGNPQALSNDDLADIVVTGLRKLRDYLPYIAELKSRFDAGERDNQNRLRAPIRGCHTWAEFCSNELGRTPRAITKALKATEKNPKLPAYNEKAVTPCGLPVATAKSAMRKAIRQGEEVAACYWARQMFLAPTFSNCVKPDIWKQVRVASTEDVGLADTSILPVLRELEATAKRVADELKSELLPLFEAIMILCRCQKHRGTDNIAIFLNTTPTYQPPTPDEVQKMMDSDRPMPVIPAEVFDKHTPEGKKAGLTGDQGVQHFLENGAKLKNESPVQKVVLPEVTRAIQKQDTAHELQKLFADNVEVQPTKRGGFNLFFYGLTEEQIRKQVTVGIAKTLDRDTADILIRSLTEAIKTGEPVKLTLHSDAQNDAVAKLLLSPFGVLLSRGTITQRAFAAAFALKAKEANL
jgi:hypothetical protein